MEVAEGQNPFADYPRVRGLEGFPEIIFDQWIGDLFVVRVAGNIVTPLNYGILGSIEYGVKVLGVNLIMVLGHSRCGAVEGAIKAVKTGTAFPGSIGTIVQAIQPSVERAKSEPGDLLQNAILENVRLGVSRISGSDPVVAPMVEEGGSKSWAAITIWFPGEVSISRIDVLSLMLDLWQLITVGIDRGSRSPLEIFLPMNIFHTVE